MKIIPEELYGNKENEIEIKFDYPLRAGAEQNIEIVIVKDKNQDRGVLSYTPPPGILFYDEDKGEYTSGTLLIKEEDLEVSGDSLVFSFDIKMNDNFEGSVNSVQVDYSYDFKSKDNGVGIGTNSYKYGHWYFKVQVAAFSLNDYSAEEVKKLFNLKEVPKVDIVDGTKRFMIGHFESYSECKAQYQSIIEKTYIQDAFVVGYKNGVRVPTLEGERFPKTSL